MAQTKKTFTQLISECVAENPANVAAEFSDRSHLSYKQLEEKVNQLANELVDQGVKPGDFVGLLVERNPYMLIGLLAIAKAGAVYVPLDQAYPKKRLAYMVEATAIQLILMTSDAQSILPQYQGAIICMDNCSGDLAKNKMEFTDRSTAESLAYVIFTSGSTGVPKGVKVSHRSVTNLLLSMRQRPGFNHSNRLLAVTTLSFDIAVLELLLPLISGGMVVIASSEASGDGVFLNQLIHQHRIDTLQATPSTWRGLLAAGFEGGHHFKALCGGEPFPIDLANTLVACCGEVWNMYGPTEATIWSTCYRIPNGFKAILIGRPIANTECYVLDERLQQVAENERGELYIGGAGVSEGYLGRDDLTVDQFIDNPYGSGRLYRTGDLVTSNSNGELSYISRIDNQLKIRGYRIETAEIESVLAGHESVAQAIVEAKSYSEADQRLIAYLRFAPGGHLTSTETRQYLRDFLPDYMIPQLIVEVDEFPLTLNGKIDRKSLPDPLLIEREHDEYQEPLNEFQKHAAAIWEKHLIIENVGLTDNFFDLGGHSVLAMLVIHDMQVELGINLHVMQLVSSTLEQLLANKTYTVNEARARSENGVDLHPQSRNNSFGLKKIKNRTMKGLAKLLGGGDLN